VGVSLLERLRPSGLLLESSAETLEAHLEVVLRVDVEVAQEVDQAVAENYNNCMAAACRKDQPYAFVGIVGNVDR